MRDAPLQGSALLKVGEHAGERMRVDASAGRVLRAGVVAALHHEHGEHQRLPGAGDRVPAHPAPDDDRVGIDHRTWDTFPQPGHRDNFDEAGSASCSRPRGRSRPGRTRAFNSLFTGHTMMSALCTPIMCCIWPEIPTAKYTFGDTIPDCVRPGRGSWALLLDSRRAGGSRRSRRARPRPGCAPARGPPRAETAPAPR